MILSLPILVREEWMELAGAFERDVKEFLRALNVTPLLPQGSVAERQGGIRERVQSPKRALSRVLE